MKNVFLILAAAFAFCACASAQQAVSTTDNAVDTSTGRSAKTRSQGQAIVEEYNSWKEIFK
ncbi:MAG: hypothetical protein LBR90_03085 [Elusimicrobiota bacterium]|jgi:hypothetical protein|nr:hypothetical protein [Elusimicrobiota bacterium]